MFLKWLFRSSCSQMLFKISVLKNFVIFTGKHRRWCLFIGTQPYALFSLCRSKFHVLVLKKIRKNISKNFFLSILCWVIIWYNHLLKIYSEYFIVFICLRIWTLSFRLSWYQISSFFVLGSFDLFSSLRAVLPSYRNQSIDLYIIGYETPLELLLKTIFIKLWGPFKFGVTEKKLFWCHFLATF